MEFDFDRGNLTVKELPALRESDLKYTRGKLFRSI